MKKIITLIMCLVCFCSYAQIWEGNGGNWLSEDIAMTSGGGGEWEEYDPSYLTLTLSESNGTLLYNPKYFPLGTEVSLTNAVPLKSGYTFVGWSDGVNLVTSVVMNSDINLVAVWSEGSFLFGFEYEEYHNGLNDVESYPITYTDDNEFFQPVSVVSGSQIDYGDWEDIINSLITPVMLKSDGTEDYELDRDNQTLKADGTPSDISNQSYDGNAMLRIKKFYISVTKDSNYKVHVKISNTKRDSSYTCYGFVDANGNEHDYAYYGMFFGSNVSDKLRSISGIKYTNITDINTARTLAQANGAGWDIDNISIYNSLCLLHVLFLKSISPANILGTKDNHNTNFNDVLGTMNNIGAFYAGNGNALNSKSLWIESFWGVHMNWCNGLYCQGNELYYKLTSPYDDTTEYTYAGKTQNSTANYSSLRNLRICENLLLPDEQVTIVLTTHGLTVSNGYGSNYMSTRNTTGFMTVNGANNYAIGALKGIWCRSGVGTLLSNIGARLTYLPSSN